MKAIELVKIILIGRSPRRTLIRSAIIAVVCIIVFKYLLIPIRIQGMSMEPTYHDGSINFVNTLYYRFRPLKRGSIVVIPIGSGADYMHLKRIVGLPGERVCFREGRLLIDGEPILEAYVKYECDWNIEEEVLVGANEYYVVGDNRSTPIDTHKKGLVYRGKIRGNPLW